MADGSPDASLITGPGDPYAAPELGIANLLTQQQAQSGLSQASAGSNPLGAAIAQQRIGQLGNLAESQLAALTPQKMAAFDDYAKALNNRDPKTGVFDPYGYAATNPNIHPYAKYRLLTASPSQMAADRLNLANAGFRAAGIPGEAAISGATARGIAEQGGPAAPGAPGASGAPPAAPGTPSAVASAPFQFPARPGAPPGTPGAAPLPGNLPTPGSDTSNPIAEMPSDPEQARSWYRKLTPQQQFAVRLHANQLAGQPQVATTAR